MFIDANDQLDNFQVENDILVKYTGNERIVAIPYFVVAIGEHAFAGCDKIEQLSIPPTVTVIEKNSFTGCVNLAWVNIPENVTNIGENAFWDCNKIQEVTLPTGLFNIGRKAFAVETRTIVLC